MFYYFGHIDQVSHMMWRAMDPGHPAFTSADIPYRSVVENLYIDGASGNNNFFLDSSNSGTQVSVAGGNGDDAMFIANATSSVSGMGSAVFDGQRG